MYILHTIRTVVATADHLAVRRCHSHYSHYSHHYQLSLSALAMARNELRCACRLQPAVYSMQSDTFTGGSGVAGVGAGSGGSGEV